MCFFSWISAFVLVNVGSLLDFVCLAQCEDSYCSSTESFGFFVKSICSKWKEIDTRRSLFVSTAPVFLTYSGWIFKLWLFKYFSTLARSKFTMWTAVQILRIAASRTMHECHINDSALFDKSQLAAMFLALVCPVHCSGSRWILHDFN